MPDAVHFLFVLPAAMWGVHGVTPNTPGQLINIPASRWKHWLNRLWMHATTEPPLW